MMLEVLNLVTFIDKALGVGASKIISFVKILAFQIFDKNKSKQKIENGFHFIDC